MNDLSSPDAFSAFHRHRAATYFVLAFSISWLGALLLVAPRLIRGDSIPKFTGLVLLAQPMHAFSTASLVVFSPGAIAPRQEALWYFLYAVTVWLLILFFFSTGRFRSG
jgi:hypothetical protein